MFITVYSWLYLTLLTFPVAICAQTSFFPAAIPLAIRSPHFSTWYNCPAGSGPVSNSEFAFWNGAFTAWEGLIRVDGLVYSFMGGFNGAKNTTANATGFQITPTRSIFTLQAGPMNVTLTFLTPIEPSDWVNQSIPFSYMSVEAQSTDGGAHNVQLYTETVSEFVTGIRPQGDQGGGLVRWQSSRTATSIYHETEPENLQPYAEVAEQAEDGKLYLATTLRPGLTWEISQDIHRTQFTNFGNLSNTEDTMTFGPLGKPWNVFSFAIDLGSIQSTTSPETWAIGYVRDPVIQYITSSGATEVRRPYWTTRYPDINALIDAFLADYPAAHDRAVAFDEKVTADAGKISPQYVDLVSLVSRQVMAAVDITVLGSSSSSTGATDAKAFMKDIGNSQRVNPVERMFAAFPAYLYLNASLGGALLAPLLESQDAQSDLLYAAQDLGSSYPNATATHQPHPQGVEQSGNMLIMMYAHARFSGDGTLLMKHYDTAKRWADYLVANTLTPSNQDTADGENSANLTNLAIKGIIGVKAMAEIGDAVQQGSDALYYKAQANNLTSSWLALAQSSDQQHLLGQFADESSWAMMYNIYADLLLGTNLISQGVLAKQTQYYKTLLSTEASPLGLPIDYVNALSNTASTAWTLLTSATVTDDGVRDQFIQYAWDRASSNKTSGQFPDVYNAATGDRPSSGGGSAGPALGAMFAHLALSIPNTTIVVPTGLVSGSPASSGSKESDKSPVGAIVGGVIGGVALLALSAGAAMFFVRRSRARAQRASAQQHEKDGEPTDYVHPFPYDGEQQNDRPHSGPLGPSSSKARERERERLAQNREPMSPPEGAAAAEESCPSDAGASSLPSVFLLGLRSEVEHLRRLMQGMREERLQPPPEYSD
ncbi:hypothetical protein OH76DRAFT_146300 [Lentinus brumalis]|uniref:DUF1793-domain-containing protein n=1 Tax=Lentinus brumalis TaxID=2498619 RepID=A0A371CP34_9APHY|nr:hypothetical protein OH76DRAFT_146300 [Polyporus brumalis]